MTKPSEAAMKRAREIAEKVYAEFGILSTGFEKFLAVELSKAIEGMQVTDAQIKVLAEQFVTEVIRPAIDEKPANESLLDEASAAATAKFGWSADENPIPNIRHETAPLMGEKPACPHCHKLPNLAFHMEKGLVEREKPVGRPSEDEICRMADIYCESAPLRDTMSVRIARGNGFVEGFKAALSFRDERFSVVVQALKESKEVIHDEFCSQNHHPFCIKACEALAKIEGAK